MPTTLTVEVAPVVAAVVPTADSVPPNPATAAAPTTFVPYEAPTHSRTPAGSTALSELFSSHSWWFARRHRRHPERWRLRPECAPCRPPRRTEAANMPVKCRQSSDIVGSAAYSVRYASRSPSRARAVRDATPLG